MKTTGEIAGALKEPLHRVLYIIRTRKIKPDGRAGIIRLFGEKKIAIIKSALKDSSTTYRGMGANGTQTGTASGSPKSGTNHRRHGVSGSRKDNHPRQHRR